MFILLIMYFQKEFFRLKILSNKFLICFWEVVKARSRLVFGENLQNLIKNYRSASALNSNFWSEKSWICISRPIFDLSGSRSEGALEPRVDKNLVEILEKIISEIINCRE